MSDDLWLSLPRVAAKPKKDKPEPRPQEPMRAQIKGPRRNPTSDQKSQRRQLKRRPAKTAELKVTWTEPGEVGNKTHITLEENGTVPTSVIAGLRGVMGEVPGEHRNKQGEVWEKFKADIAANGITHAIFITVDYADLPRISEGNHRRDAAVELGLAEVPVQIRYFGHAEREGTVTERMSRTAKTAAQTATRGFRCELIGPKAIEIYGRMTAGTATAADILYCAMSSGSVGNQWALAESEYGADWADQGAEDYAFVDDDMYVKTFGAENLADYPPEDIPRMGLGELSVILIGETDAAYVNPEWDAEIESGSKIELTEVRYNAGWGWKKLPAHGLRATAAMDWKGKQKTRLDGPPFAAKQVGDIALKAWHWFGDIQIFAWIGDVLVGDANIFIHDLPPEVLVGVSYDDKDKVGVGTIEVHPDYRRRGVGTAMYAWGEELTGRRMIPDPGHTPDAEAFWRQPNRSFGAHLANWMDDNAITIHDPSRDAWAEMQPGVWLRKDDSAMRIVKQMGPGEFAWQVSVPVGFGPHSGELLSGTAKTLEAAQAKAMKATTKDDEAAEKHQERMDRLLDKAAVEEYQTGHQPGDDGPSLDFMDDPDSYYPSDVYEHPEYYTPRGPSYSDESIAVMQRVRGKPNAMVTIYRAAPPGQTTINTGDWVAITPSYARIHRESNGRPDWVIYSASVPARSIRNGGNDLVEWGYFGTPVQAHTAARTASLRTDIELLRPQLSAAVQHIVDEWDQDAEGFDEEFGYGGACDQAADAMASVLGDHGIETTSGGADGDDHAWVVALRGEEVVGVDIPPGVYETGGGYSWTKRQDVSISPRDVEVWDIDVPAENFREGAKTLDQAIEDLADAILNAPPSSDPGPSIWGERKPRVDPDWATVLSKVKTMYRGYGLRVSDDVYGMLFGQSLWSSHDKAAKVLELVSQRGLGTHWTTHRGEAAGFAGMTADRGDVRVIVEAHPPNPGDVLVGEMTKGMGIQAWDDSYGEQEIPIRSGAPIRVKGVWWAPGGPRPLARADDGGGWAVGDVNAIKAATLHVGIKFEPGQMASWGSTKPWNLSRAEAEAQLVPGWWFKSQRGTESASWEKGYIRPSPEFFGYAEEVRRAIAYHEAGHAMVEAAGGVSSLKDPLSIIDLPGATTLGYNAEEVLAEGYSVLWTEPSWFDQYTAVRDLVIGLARKANFPLPSSARTAMRPPIPVVQWKPSKDGHGGSGVVSAERGPIVAYRGFGSWGEAKDSLRRGEWISSGMFTVRGEGDTQMALDLNDVLQQSGMHRLRGTGFLGFIEADISGLPFATFVTIESNPVDETRGNFEPNTGLGIGIVGGIPLDRIRRVVAIGEDGTWNEMSVQGLRNSIDKLEDRAGWEPEVKHRPETHRFPIIWKKRAKEYHKANYNQSGAECGTQLGYDYENALVSQGDLMKGGPVRNLWMRRDEMVKGLPKKPCPECFPWARTQMVAALGLEAVISVAEETMERAGLVGRTLYIPQGHADDPEHKKAMRPYVEMVQNLVGRPINFYANDYILDTDGGGAQALTDGWNRIVVRPVTNMMTILHEVAHARLHEAESYGHTPEFVSTVEHLYREHLGDAAADQFMTIIGDRV